jgi:hypothetical protein
MSNLDFIRNAVNKAKNGTPSNKSSDDTMWKLEGDKAGNGMAVIRFLPAKDDESVPFVKVFSHGFQGPTSKWFIEDCPTTIGQNCPACEANGVLWNSGKESDKEIVRKRKRRTAYVANILVVSDPKNPDNDGKVMQFKFGQKIFDKIIDKINPPVDDKGNLIDPDDIPVNPFDPIEGANFKLKMRKLDGYANFDKSEFGPIEEIGSKKDIAAIVSKLHDLSAYTNPSKFKTYDELSAKLSSAVGVLASVKASNSQLEESAPPKSSAKATPSKDDDDDEDGMDYFKKLADEDD